MLYFTAHVIFTSNFIAVSEIKRCITLSSSTAAERMLCLSPLALPSAPHKPLSMTQMGLSLPNLRRKKSNFVPCQSEELLSFLRADGEPAGYTCRESPGNSPQTATAVPWTHLGALGWNCVLSTASAHRDKATTEQHLHKMKRNPCQDSPFGLLAAAPAPSRAAPVPCSQRSCSHGSGPPQSPS